jgi:hypothetical protein
VIGRAEVGVVVGLLEVVLDRRGFTVSRTRAMRIWTWVWAWAWAWVQTWA